MKDCLKTIKYECETAKVTQSLCDWFKHHQSILLLNADLLQRGKRGGYVNNRMRVNNPKVVLTYAI